MEKNTLLVPSRGALGGRRDRLRRGAGKWLWRLLRTFLLLGMAFVLLYPLLYMISMALRPVEQVYDPTVVWIPRSLTLDNLKLVFELVDFKSALLNTAVISLGSSLLTILSCSLVGYGFARFDFKLKPLFFAGVLLTILVPPQTIIVPMSVEMKYFDFFFLGQIGRLLQGSPFVVNLLDTPFCMMVPALFASGIRSGLFIFMFRQFFKGLPKALEDAAAVDGCGQLKTFVRIMLPCSGSVFLIVFLFSLVSYWNDFYYTGMFFDNLNTVSQALSSIAVTLKNAGVGDANKTAAYMQAGSLISILPPLVMYIIFQRQFTESIERTGIVG